MRRVVITGMGCISPVGNNVADTWKSLLEGRYGAAPITRFDTSQHKTKFAAEVKGFDAAAVFGTKDSRRMDASRPSPFTSLAAFGRQGKTAGAAKRLVEDSLLLEQAGCFSLVLESVPARLAELITSRLSIPTIGIGAGVHCDGQVLETHDLLGLFDRFTPRFVRQYARLHEAMQAAFAAYMEDVQAKAFPAPEHSVDMEDAEWQALLKDV